ncbi:MAG: hypothetical protein GY788_27555 [bacterium]|nr:hypothetical protein [bacterium]
MKANQSSLRANVVMGVVTLLPVGVLIFILVKLFGALKTIADPLSPYLGTNIYLATTVLITATILTALVLAYFVGWLINTRTLSLTSVGSRARKIIPGYSIIENILRGATGETMAHPPALISLLGPDSAVLGFVMEDDGDEFLTVFLPSSPVLTVGTIHIVERHRVQLIEGSVAEAAACISQWGLGMKELRGNAVPARLRT